MKKNRGFIWLTLGILVLFTMACSLSDTIGGLFSSVKLDPEVYTSEDGGFEYRIPVDYDQEENYGSVQILAPGADMDTGPVYILTGSVGEELGSIDKLLSDLKDNLGFDFPSDPKKIKVGGKSGLQVDFSVEEDEDGIEGRLVVVIVSPTQNFVMLGGATPEMWKDEGKVFNKILGTIKFFELDPDAD